MEYNFDAKVREFFDKENAMLEKAIKEREDEISHIELTGLVHGMIAKGMSTILQEYHSELMKYIK